MSCCYSKWGYTDDTKNEQNWNTRNNSANVAEILNPEGEEALNSYRKHVVVSNKCHETCRIPKFISKGCYCNRTPIFPKLAINRPPQEFKSIRKPKCKFMGRTYCRNSCKCNVIQQEGQSAEEDNTNSENETIPENVAQQSTNTNPMAAKNVEQTQNPDYNKSQQMKNHPKPKNTPIKKIDKRVAKKNKRNSKDYHLGNSLQVNTNIGYDSSLSRTRNNRNDSVLEDKNDCYADLTSDMERNAAICENIKNLNTFRNENYFDCYSSGNLLRENPVHKCVYRFHLNNRLLPEPSYADIFGTSRCIECDKLMKPDVLYSEKPSTGAKKTTKYLANGSKEFGSCASQLSKQKINIGAKDDIIQINIPITYNAFNDLFKTSFKIRNPASENSLALRHQRGVV